MTAKSSSSTTINGPILPAEWERQRAVLLSWPHPQTDWAYMLDSVTECFTDIVSEISRFCPVVIVAPDRNIVVEALTSANVGDSVKIIELPTNDTWARDFGMICTIDRETHNITACDFKFNGWGLKFAADKDNLITRGMFEKSDVCKHFKYANHLGFVLEGGSIDSDGLGTILTTAECLLSPNRNGDLDRDAIERHLETSLGCNRLLWLEHGALEGDDTDSHVDTLARFLTPDTIAYSACDREDDSHYDELRLMQHELQNLTTAHGKPYRLVPLPIPHPVLDPDDGSRLPATYANFLITNGAVLVPVYGDEHYDALALQRIKEAMPQYQVVGIDCRALVRQHGSLHCVTMQIPS